MIVVKLKDQLGNQMFAYASIKSLALEKGYDFAFIREPLPGEFINDSDPKYGNDLYTIFKLPEFEWIKKLPQGYKVYVEKNISERNTYEYPDLVKKELLDNSIADGHFITTAFFRNRLPQLREWYLIPADIQQKINLKLEKIREKANQTIISVHFRVGPDYVKNGYKLVNKYWWEAAELMKDKFDEPVFVCVYDRKSNEVNKFISKFNAVDIHGSLIEDMCLISKCDGNIVCNSTFSIMSALLNEHSKITICPKKYPTEAGYLPDNVYMDSWIKVGTGRRDWKSWLYYIRRRYLRKSYLKKVINRLWGKA